MAGPIERSTRLLPQFRKKTNFNYDRVVAGLQLMLCGFFLKVVIANKLALTVDKVFNNLADYSGHAMLLATYFFTFQIFCDFAGYSAIAIGTLMTWAPTVSPNCQPKPFFGP